MDINSIIKEFQILETKFFATLPEQTLTQLKSNGLIPEDLSYAFELALCLLGIKPVVMIEFSDFTKELVPLFIETVWKPIFARFPLKDVVELKNVGTNGWVDSEGVELSGCYFCVDKGNKNVLKEMEMLWCDNRDGRVVDKDLLARWLGYPSRLPGSMEEARDQFVEVAFLWNENNISDTNANNGRVVFTYGGLRKDMELIQRHFADCVSGMLNCGVIKAPKEVVLVVR